MFEPGTDLAGRFYRGYFDRTPPWADVAISLLLGLFIGSVGVGWGKLAGTEGHRAITAHQMVLNGEWLVPFLYDQPYLRKPPLQYWIFASLETVTGLTNTWLWRLPSAIFGAITAAFLGYMTQRWYGRMAGLVAGVSCCGMVALWGQNRTAEIDALNTMACVICACLILDLNWSPVRDRRWASMGIGLAFGAAMLTKGPAGIAPIIGALVGPSIVNRSVIELKRPWAWAGLAIGLLIFCIYAMAAWLRFREMGLSPDTSGLLEAVQNPLSNRVSDFPRAIALPLVLLAFSLPVSISVILAFHPTIWIHPIVDPRNASPQWPELDCLFLRGLLGTLLVALVTTMVFGLSRERYSYVWLPLICPVAGAVAAALERGEFPGGRIWNVKIDRLLACCAGLYTIGSLVFVALYYQHASGKRLTLFSSAIASIILCVLTLRWIALNRVGTTGWGLVGLVLLVTVPYSAWGELDRNRRSTYQGAMAIAAKVPAGSNVTTGQLVMDQPEIFFYAKVSVESHPFGFAHAMNFPTSRWLVLNEAEYNAWKKEIPGQLQGAENVDAPAPAPAIYLAWYLSPSEAMYAHEDATSKPTTRMTAP